MSLGSGVGTGDRESAKGSVDRMVTLGSKFYGNSMSADI